MKKPKENYKQPTKKISKDFFQTPRYAVELLLPYIPRHVGRIWECACGECLISYVFIDNGYLALSTDKFEFPYPAKKFDFLEETKELRGNDWAIVTNPPYSVKKKFFMKCLEYEVPFALLIPTDYSQWIIDAITKYGAEKLIPYRRIKFITPYTIQRINMRYNENFKNIHQIPNALLVDDAQDKTATFHSMWLTWGFNLGSSENFVDLTNEDMDRII